MLCGRTGPQVLRETWTLEGLELTFSLSSSSRHRKPQTRAFHLVLKSASDLRPLNLKAYVSASMPWYNTSHTKARTLTLGPS